jgi:pimeloyl-ACP methyl ester carboxylesterase
MNRRVLSLLLILALTISLIASCGKPKAPMKEPMPSPSAPDITLDSGYNQTELEEAVSAAGGGCDIGTLTTTDNNDGTYTVECRIGDNIVTATGNIEIIQKIISTVPPRIQTAMCQFNVPPGQNVECGYLIVPEDRDIPNGKTVRIHFAIFKSTNEHPAPDPVVYLAGGPGIHALDSLLYTFNECFAPFLANRDFIVLDQRGTGYSEPALDCPDFIDLTFTTLNQDLSPEEYSEMLDKAHMYCANRLVLHYNLSAYNSAGSAVDLNDLRLALGYQEWNLFGTSYGTRLALTTMRDFPDGIRSVILDSTYPPQVNFYAAQPGNLNRALDVLFAGCAADPTCCEEYPELEAVFWEMVDKLNESPIVFPVTHPFYGETYEVLMDGDSLISFIYQSLYATEVIPLLPKLIFEIRNGNYSTLALLEASMLASMELASTGMYYSVQCNEEISFSTPEELNEVYNSYPKLQGLFYNLADTEYNICAICQDHWWAAGEASPIENKPVYSEIPTLIMAGDYDPITPPSWGQIAAETLPNNYYYEFPGVGHGASVSGEECPLNIALAFLDDPTSEPDAICIDAMDGPKFYSKIPDAVTLVPFTDITFNISGVVPKDWISVAPGLYIRSKLGLVRIIQQRIPGLSSELLLEVLTNQMGLDKVPERTGKDRAGGRVWSLYELEVNGLSMDLAITECANSSMVVALRSTKDERDFYYDEVFLPAIDALTPID